MLDDLVELLDRLVDLLGAGILLAAGGADLLDQLRGLLDIGDHLGQKVAGSLGDVDAVGGQFRDLPGRLLAPLGELSHFARHHREPLAVLAGTGRLDGGV